MLLAASVGRRPLPGDPPGTPPGTVYALVALGLRPHLQDVRGLQPGLRRPGVRVGRHVLPGPGGVGLGHRPRPRPVRVRAGAARWGCSSSGWSSATSAPARRSPKLVVALGLTVALPALFDLIVDFEAVAGRTPTGIVPDGATVFYDPFGVYRFSRDELVAMVVAVAGDGRPRRSSSGTRRSGCACERWWRARG